MTRIRISKGPYKKQEDRHDAKINVYFTKREYTDLIDFCNKFDLSVASMVRDATNKEIKCQKKKNY